MDWIKTGWGPNLQQEFSPTLPYVLDCSEVQISNRCFFDVSTSVINKIVSNYPGPYYLMASGGVDSQAMIQCWIKSEVPFQILSFKYNEIYNEHDLVNLSLFAEINQLKVEFKNFDVINFLENDLLAYATEYQCISPQICSFMKMCDEIKNGTIIFSGNLLTLKNSGLNYTMLGLQRYAKKKLNIVPFFFQHDAELAACLLPILKNNVLSENEKDNYVFKIKGYEHLGMKIIPQERKLSGFEKIKDLYDKRTDLVSPKDKLEFSYRSSKRYFDIEYRYKLAKTIKYVENVTYILPKTYAIL